MGSKNTWHFLDKNLVFIDSIQFMNSSLDKLVKNLFDEDFKYLVEVFIDVNNLYDLGLSEYLPCGRFKWLKNIDGFDVMSISGKSPISYYLEVNLEYPDELHELHNDYPLAP